MARVDSNLIVIRVLLVDDDEDDYLITRDLLQEIADTHFELDWVSDGKAALRLMADGGHDLYLLDYRLGPITGLDLIREAIQLGCNAPMILLTGLADRTIDIAAAQAGAADYLEKGSLSAVRLERSIRYSLQQKRHAEELERKVAERTAELARINQALEAEISERRKAEEALREADRRKDRFLATLAHELRNPLVPIRNALEIMRIAPDRPDVLDRSRSMIDRQVGQMVRLIDDLLDLSRITRGSVELRRERIRLSDVIDDAIEGIRPALELAGHDLSVSLPESPIVVYADPMRLAQILLNLLNNAAKYTDRGGKIRLEVEAIDPWAIIRVIDNGLGLTRDQLTRVFDMFTQVHHERTHTQSGLGIGLSLVRSLVEQHGGTVQAESDGAGQGSTFTVRIPIEASDHAAAVNG